MSGVDRELLQAWLTGRSLARDVALPVADRGGFRVDTGSPTEIRRWVYADAAPGIADAARSVSGPGYLIKLCGETAALAALAPPDWRVESTGYFMIASMMGEEAPLPEGYSASITQGENVVEVVVTTAAGEFAARGFGAETDCGFTYDRIVTETGHRRQGLGLAVMTRLAATKRDHAVPDLLVATEMGRSLYEVLGWKVLSRYSTATSPGTQT